MVQITRTQQRHHLMVMPIIARFARISLITLGQRGAFLAPIFFHGTQDCLIGYWQSKDFVASQINPDCPNCRSIIIAHNRDSAEISSDDIDDVPSSSQREPHDPTSRDPAFSRLLNAAMEEVQRRNEAAIWFHEWCRQNRNQISVSNSLRGPQDNR
jgi:hypothetical protein